MDYSKFVPQRRSASSDDANAVELEESMREEAKVNDIVNSMKAISETAQVVDEAKIKEETISHNEVKANTTSNEFKNRRGGR